MTNSPSRTIARMYRLRKRAITPYNRKKYSRLAGQASMAVYHRKHVQKLVQMVIKVVGADPSWLAGQPGRRSALAPSVCQVAPSSTGSNAPVLIFLTSSLPDATPK